MTNWDATTAEWYAEKYGEYATNRLAVDRLELASSTCILDVGCGTGAALRHAAKRVKTGSLVGADVVPRMVEIAQERAASQPTDVALRFVVAPAEALPVGDAQFDVVLAFDSYDHWAKPVKGLAEVRRVLRPDGRFVVVKDGGVAALRSFGKEVEAAGFEVVREEHIEAEGVAFTLWQCRIRSRSNGDGTGVSDGEM